MGADRQLAAVMFTDMEGFTALMQSDEQLALAKRDKYTNVLREKHDTFGGTIVQFFGDGSLSIFPNSVDAVACAISVQEAFQAPLEVPVRIGIHVGNVIVESTGIVGDAVNIASRIESFGLPGAVMVSDSIHDQVRNQGTFDFVDLGKFKLKNVGRPFTIYAIAVDGLAVPAPDFPHGKGEQLAILPANLPEPASPLVGRGSDLAALTELIAEHRVLTITGPGGIGKTRTAIEVCRQIGGEFLDGVSFVALADVTDPTQFVPTLANALDVKEVEGRTLGDGVTALIGDKKALLLLDNLEQIIEAAPTVTQLVASCPELRLVVTSRTPMRIAAEREYQLEPLLLPPQGKTIPEELAAYPAVALFVQRAQRVNPTFSLRTDNAEAVAEVCRRMDGLPLAIELAAARTRILTVEALLARLEHALDLLTGGRRDLPKRHQTLRAAIDWSHSLLTDAEQRLFRRMALFSSGATLDAVEATCAEPGGDILDDLESLVDKALVTVRDGRFAMLQTIREFATERLDESGETGEVAKRHAAHFGGLATEIGAGIEGTEQLAWMGRAMTDEANMQAAFDHLASRAQAGDAKAAELGMIGYGDLWMYWHIRGKHLSARKYALSLLEISKEPTRGRARLLITAGLASWTLRSNQQALEEWSEAYRIAEDLGDRHTMANATVGLALGHIGIDLEKALDWASKSIELGRELDYPFQLSQALGFDGVLHAISGDLETAKARYEEALSIEESRGDHQGAGISLGGLAQLAAMGGDIEGALALYERSLASFEALGDRAEEARVLGEMAWTYLAHGDSGRARHTFLASAQAYEDVGSVPGVGISMIGLAAVEAVGGQPERAVTIAYAAERFSEVEGVVNVYSEDSPGRPYLEAARAELSAEVIAAAEQKGRLLTVRETMRMVRE